jgi:CBS-domain-containing membrane protein
VPQRRDPADLRVRDVMTAEVVCCQTCTTLDEARGAMKNRRIRHLPVVDDHGELAGIVSIGDVVKSQISELQFERDQLEGYVSG